MSPRCPCDPRRTLERCCGPHIDGAGPPTTAEALMRSRYTAYTLGAVDYLLATCAAATRAAIDREDLAAYCRTLSGLGLRILATEAGGPDDDTGVVAFAATLRAGGRKFVQRERSRFVREDGRWVYLDGELA